MNLLTLENITKSYSEKQLVNNICLGINEGEKIGLIGVNGTGKSTLLKIIAGVEYPDTGSVIKANRVRIEYLPQNPYYDEDASVLEQVFKGTSNEMKLLRDYQEILNKLSVEFDDSLNTKLITIQDKIDTLNLWDLESEAKSVLTKLGITNFNQKISELSGGQRKRISLASALITPCELLILDEPTNHLDNDTIDWLEEYLNSKKGSLLMITHDRYFLDRVTNRIIELDKGRLFSYEGNYSDFLEKKVCRIELESSMEEKRKSLIKKELEWVKRGARARTTKQKARLQRFDELVNTENYTTQSSMDISTTSSRLGKKIIELHNISKYFDNKVVIDNFEYTLTRADRIGIIGKNGMGKSTLINIINGKILPDNGFIEIGETVKIGCFSQDDSHMHTDMRAIDYVKEASDYIETADGTKITASQMCERFLFDGTMQYTHIGRLSGGERRRLHLLRTLMSSPNVLLLDEPTNDLDIETLNRLEDYLDGFDGVVICVSHDRYFLDRICNKIFAYEGNGCIHVYTGNYSEYLNYRDSQGIEFTEFSSDKNISVESISKTIKKEKQKKDLKLKFTFNEQREFDCIDEDISTLEKNIQNLELDLTRFSTDFTKLQEVMNKKDDLEKQLEYKYERWEYLNNLAEEIEKNKSNQR